MPLTPFATHTDLEARLGVSLSPAEQTRADTLLADASDLVRLAAKQQISEVADDVLTRRGLYGDRLRLPQRPVTSVDSITYQFVETLAPEAPLLLETDEYYLEGNDLVRYAQGSWFGPEYQLVITYTHGYSSPPILAKTTAIEAVVRVWVNPGSVISEMHGSESFTYSGGASNPAGLALTEDECYTLEREYSSGGRSGSIGLR